MASERFRNKVARQNKEREERDYRIWRGTATEEEKAAQKRESTYRGYTTGGYWKDGKKKTTQTSQTTMTQAERNQKRLQNARDQREGYVKKDYAVPVKKEETKKRILNALKRSE
jgi:hypothetical protein